MSLSLRTVIFLALLAWPLAAAARQGNRPTPDERAARLEQRVSGGKIFALAKVTAQEVMKQGGEAMVRDGKKLLTDPEIAAAISHMVDGTLQQVEGRLLGTMPGLTAEVSAQVAASARQSIVEATAVMIEQALSDESLAQVEEASAAIALRLATDLSPVVLSQLHLAINALAPQLGEATATQLRENVGPAMGDIMRNDLIPAAVDMLADEEFNAAARMASSSVATGALDALALSLSTEGPLGQVLAAERQRTMAAISDTIAQVIERSGEEARRTSTRITNGLMVLALVLAALAVIVLYAWYRARKGVGEREEALALLAWRIKVEAEKDEHVRSLVDTIRDAQQGDERGASLRSFFKRRPELNARKAG